MKPKHATLYPNKTKLINLSSKKKGPLDLHRFVQITQYLSMLFFWGILTLTRVRHTVSSKRVIVHTNNVVISNIQMQMISDMPVLFGK